MPAQKIKPPAITLQNNADQVTLVQLACFAPVRPQRLRQMQLASLTFSTWLAIRSDHSVSPAGWTVRWDPALGHSVLVSCQFKRQLFAGWLVSIKS